MKTHDYDARSIAYASRQLLAGGVAGSVAKSVVAPLDRVKILFQASNPQYLKYAGTWTGVFHATHEIYVHNGVRGLFQGHTATLIRIFPYAAIKFMAYSRFHRLLMPSRDHETNLRRFLAGSLSGTTSVLITYPLELIRVRLAFQTRSPSSSPASTLHRQSLYQTIKQIYYEGSIKQSTSSAQHPVPVSSPNQSRIFTTFPLLKFYRGFSVTLTGMIPYSGTSFLVYGYARSKLAGSTTYSPVENLVAGALSGILGQTVSYPFEVVRRRMQVSGLTQPDRWLRWNETAKAIWIQRGWRGFFVGLSIGLIKIVPMTAVSFAVWEEMKRIMEID